ncbi:GNAT family N-acetyltransferase [Pseudomonas yamanorum]|uniref:GNAT family N-acetyltransferase n=1 Tax=Pseudomonas yamanorum TaxID=515393 RepID=UPI0015A447D8|nr:GNAT family N-acetyltransferase [Pseudomonas yamanorum]NVZ91313.1 GNAT family N-acetyltransferase [Pseudomonas yamanorum]
MDTSVAHLNLVTISQEQAIDVADSLLGLDENRPFGRAVDVQDLIEQRCLLIWADILTPGIGRTTGYVGFCTINVCDEFAELYRFFVAPEYRRLGIGRSTLNLLSQYVTSEFGFSEFYMESLGKEAGEFWRKALEDFSVSKAGHRQLKLSFAATPSSLSS